MTDHDDCVACAGTYEHFIYAPTRKAAEAVAADLTRDGYLVPGPPEDMRTWDDDGDPYSPVGGPWILEAYGSPEKAFAEGGRDDIEAACARHGAEYTGGGMYVGPLGTLDPDDSSGG